MSELNVDSTEEERTGSQPFTTNAPMMIALACALLLLALFVATLQADGQTGSANDGVQFGSISGRVEMLSDPHREIGGVRVLVRRVHAGVADFYFDRITAADGRFEFKYLLPGRYTVEIDRRTVPDAIFPAASRLAVIDVVPNRGSYAELAIVRSDPSGILSRDGSTEKKH